MNICWLCDRCIADPPEVIGQYLCGTYKVAHRRCWQTLGEAELDLQAATDPGPTR